MNKEKNNSNRLGGITKVEDIPSVIEALREIYDESVEIQLYRQENIWAVRKRITNFKPFSPDATRPWEGLGVSA